MGIDGAQIKKRNIISETKRSTNEVARKHQTSKPEEKQGNKQKTPQQKRPAPQKPNLVTCQHCATEMKKTTRVEASVTKQLFGVFAFLFGLLLLFLFPFGTIFGLCIMILSARAGYKKQKIWLCPNCNYYFQRAK